MYLKEHCRQSSISTVLQDHSYPEQFDMDNFLSFISQHKYVNFKSTSEIKEYPINNFKTDLLSYLFTPNKEIIKTIFRKLLN